MLLLLVGLVTGQCGKGCLRCTSNRCVMCDSINNYYLSENGCVLSTITNCYFLSQTGDCLECSAGYLRDETSKACVEPPTKIEHCDFYESESICSRCSLGYFFNRVSSSCVSASTIPHCLYLDSSSTCQLCEPKYLLSSDRKTCEMNSGLNCSVFSPVKCVACAINFVFNPNLPYKLLAEGNEAIISAVSWGVSYKAVLSRVLPSCEFSEIRNCAVYKSATACGRCASGYMLDQSSGSCLIFPSPQIPHCGSYSSQSECRSCVNGYYLSSNMCRPVTPIANCRVYDGSASQSTCVACGPSQYVLLNICVARKNVVSHCAQLATDSDSCVECADGFELSPDALACVERPADCGSSLIELSPAGYTIRCVECRKGFRLKTTVAAPTWGVCVVGGIENCAVFEPHPSVDYCKTCDNGFYLIDNECLAHYYISDCALYDSDRPHACSQCSSRALLFERANSCSPINLVAYCAKYSAPGTCASCQGGFYLSGNYCFPIDVANCLKSVDGVGCSSCESGYFLWNNKCFTIEPNIAEQCAKITLTNTAAGQVPVCDACVPGAIEIPLTQPICYNSTYFADPLGLNKGLIPGCSVYDSDGSCALCNKGYFLQTDLTCATTACAKGVISLRVRTSGGNLQLSGKNICYNGAFANCAEFGLTASTFGSGCVRCAAGFWPVVNVAGTDDGFTSPDSSSINAGSFAAVARYPTLVSCVGTRSAPDCLFHAQDGATVVCVRCGLGLSGTPSAFTTVMSPPRSKFASCDIITNCMSSFEFSGLSKNLQMMFSCHRCSKGYPLSNVFTESDIYQFMPGKVATACVELAPEITVANCVLYYKLFLSSTDQLAGTLMCAACAPGYTLGGGTCTKIARCDKALWPNSCGNCDSGYALPYVGQTVNYGRCSEAARLPNCVVAEEVGGVVKGCLVCSVGFTPNLDGFCEGISTPKCLASSVTPSLILAPTLFTAYLQLMISADLLGGCGACDSGFVPMQASLFGCLKSTYLLGALLSNTVLVTDCLQYDSAASSPRVPVCLACRSNMVLRADGRACLTATGGLAHCFRSNSAGSACAECVEGYSLVKNTCVQNSIVNCKKYSQTLSALTCISCSAGFSLVSNSCLRGNQLHCEEFADSFPDRCTKCQSGFSLVVRSDSSTYCFRNDPQLHCETFDSALFLLGILKCIKCKFSFAPNDISTIKSACLPVEPVTGCAEYIKSQLTAVGSLTCSVCYSGYYLSAGNCLPLTPAPNCKTYSTSEDACVECQPGFFPSASSACSRNPQGINGCANYAGPNVCDLCDSDFFLSDGQCLRVSSPVLNCKSYGSSDSLCAECLNGYILVANSCILGGVSRCVVYDSTGNCLSCEPGFYFWNNACNAYPDSNCVKIENAKCVSCTQGMVPQGLLCSQPSSPIDNCLFYSSATQCEVCAAGYSILQNKTKCVSTYSSQVDPNCVKSVITDTPTCALCDPEMYFSGGICTKCSTSSSCLFCDPTKPSSCLVCKPGSYMTKTASCQLISQPPTNQPDVVQSSILPTIIVTIFLSIIAF